MTEAIDLAVPLRPRRLDRRRLTLAVALLGLLLLVGVMAGAALLGTHGIAPDFTARLAGPSLAHWFGTDQLGHDMLARTVHGLNLSLWVGLAAALISVLIAALLAVFAVSCGSWADALVAFMVDTAMGLPHLVLLVLISFSLGGGTMAVIVAVAVTHWPRLTRILRAELLQLRHADYVIAARRMGKSWLHIGRRHFLPQLWPQALVGLVLLFPHAILHEAALTFIGFGLEATKPAIGVLLADAMRYLLAGKWWLGLFPGLCLLALVLCFDAVGNGLRLLTDPRQGQA